MIEKFEWSEEYSIHNELIDEQHQHLFSLGNTMLQFARIGETVERVEEAVVALYNYVKTHFKREEEYMESINFPGLDDHRHLHDEIVLNMNQIMKTSANMDALVYKFKRLLYDWISSHILTEDRKIEVFLQKEEKKKAAAKEENTSQNEVPQQ